MESRLWGTRWCVPCKRRPTDYTQGTILASTLGKVVSACDVFISSAASCTSLRVFVCLFVFNIEVSLWELVFYWIRTPHCCIWQSAQGGNSHRPWRTQQAFACRREMSLVMPNQRNKLRKFFRIWTKWLKFACSEGTWKNLEEGDDKYTFPENISWRRHDRCKPPQRTLPCVVAFKFMCDG